MLIIPPLMFLKFVTDTSFLLYGGWRFPFTWSTILGGALLLCNIIAFYIVTNYEVVNEEPLADDDNHSLLSEYIVMTPESPFRVVDSASFKITIKLVDVVILTSLYSNWREFRWSKINNSYWLERQKDQFGILRLIDIIWTKSDASFLFNGTWIFLLEQHLV